VQPLLRHVAEEIGQGRRQAIKDEALRPLAVKEGFVHVEEDGGKTHYGP
jgi:hypothetical protein